MRFCEAKIVEGGSRAKGKPKDFHFALPSRSLCYVKIVQGESRAKEKPKDFHFALPSRSLYYLKIVQGESRAKEKQVFLLRLPILWASPASRIG